MLENILKRYDKGLIAIVDRGGTPIYYFDKVREESLLKTGTKGKEAKQVKGLMSRKYKFQIPMSNAALNITKGGKEMSMAYSIDGVSFSPVRLDISDNPGSAAFKPLSIDLKMAFFHGVEAAVRRMEKARKWQMLAPVVALAITGITMTFFLWVAADNLISLSGIAKGMTAQLSTAMENLAEASKILAAAKGITPPP